MAKLLTADENLDVEIAIGMTGYVRLKFRNNTKYDLENDCYLGLMEKVNDKIFEPIEKIPFNTLVKKFSSYNILVPIKVKKDAFASKPTHIYLGSFDRAGGKIGSLIPLRVTVIKAETEEKVVDLYSLSMFKHFVLAPSNFQDTLKELRTKVENSDFNKVYERLI